MNPPPFPEDWQTDWHLVGRTDQLPEHGAMDVVVADLALRLEQTDAGLIAVSKARRYPVMVVDDEIFVLLSDAPD